MSIPYWPETLPQGPRTGLSFGPQDVKASFKPDIGEPVTRPRTTGAPFMARASFMFEGADVATFEQFFNTTLAQGSKRFAWRDTISGDVRMWRFMGAYSRKFLLKTLATVEADMMMLPGEPWFAPYARAGLSTVPAFVADYDNGVYGIDGKRTPASSMPTVEGTYLVQRTTTTEITEGQETLTAGDITETQPTGTLKIIGWPL